MIKFSGVVIGAQMKIYGFFTSFILNYDMI